MIRLHPVLVAALALSLTACAAVTRYDAAGDVHALLVAVRDSDRAAFDAHVDRTALKAQLRTRLMAEAFRQQDPTGWAGAVGVMLAGPLIDFAVDRLLQPEVFLAVAESPGYSPTKPIPDRAVLSAAIKPLEEDRVCLTAGLRGPCVLVFRNEDNVWRLVAFEGDPRTLKPVKALTKGR